MSLQGTMRQPQPGPKVLEVVNSFHLGGTEGQVVELLRGLRGRYRMSAAGLLLEGPHLEAIRAMGLEPLGLPLGGSFASTSTPKQIARLALHLRREKIELVHAHDFYTALLAVPAARLAGAKVIVGRLDLAHWLGTAQRAALAAACWSADHVVANAQAIKRSICRVEHLPADRVSVIPNGLDLERFDAQRSQPPIAPLPQLEGKVVIAHVANMTHPVKAQELLFEAMARLLPRVPQAALLLVGDGPRRHQLEAIAGSQGIAGSVHFLGRRPDVPAILARSHIGVLCSSAEGLSNAIIEGMAASLPMVDSDAGGNPELVRDGESGFVVMAGSAACLAARLEHLAKAPELRTRMGQAGRAFVERELGMSRLLERHDQLYRRVLES
jgi:glycosyltransferase involved in cell wall biosynthesis